MQNDNGKAFSRRGFVGLLAATAITPALPAWRLLFEGPRLTARPGKPTAKWEPGLTPLWDTKPGAFLYIPKSYDPATPIPLVVALHGATQRANFSLRIWTTQADAAGFVLLAPDFPTAPLTGSGSRSTIAICSRASSRIHPDSSPSTTSGLLAPSRRSSCPTAIRIRFWRSRWPVNESFNS